MNDDLHLRITASQDQFETFRAALQGLLPVTRAEEIADLRSAPAEDSSSAGLTDDLGPGVHYLQIGLEAEADRERARSAIVDLAEHADLPVEFLPPLG